MGYVVNCVKQNALGIIVSTLYIVHVWTEYTIGLHGNKPAKSFSSKERGADKTKYCRRKRFWDAVEKVTASHGINSALAISCIRIVYGRNNATVTKILEELGKDKTLTSYSAYTF